MKTRIWTFSAFAFLFTALLFLSNCKRDFLEPTQPDAAKEARYWFNKKYDKELTVSNEGRLIYGNQYPDWRFIKTYKSAIKNFTVIEAPLLEVVKKEFGFIEDFPNKKTGTYQTSIKKLLIFKKGNDFREIVMTIIPRKSYLQSYPDYSKISTENFPENFSGLINFETFGGIAIGAIYVNNGKIISKGRFKRDDSVLLPNTNNTTQGYDIFMTCVTCTVQISSGDLTGYNNNGCDEYSSECGGFAYDPYANYTDACLSNAYNAICECSNLNNCWWFGDGGNSTYQNANIIDSLQGFPCAQNILTQVPSFNTTLSETIQNTFGVSQAVNIKFTIDSSLIGTLTNAETYAPSVVNGVFTSTIKMNPWVLSHSTQEYILLTMLHEAIHSYIDYNWHLFQTGVIDTATFRQRFLIFYDIRHNNTYTISEYAQHEQMTYSYLSKLASTLQAFNPSISNYRAIQMAWMGLYNTSLWYTPYPGDTSAIQLLDVSARDTSLHLYNPLNLTLCP